MGREQRKSLILDGATSPRHPKSGIFWLGKDLSCGQLLQLAPDLS
jgi:hypothetical protein